jgi:DmsE family decaheme c-type cytochrome
MNALRFHVSIGVLGVLVAALVPLRGTSDVLAAGTLAATSAPAAFVLDSAMRARRDVLAAALAPAVAPDSLAEPFPEALPEPFPEVLPEALPAQQRGAAKAATPAADYVGSDTCLACHEDATKHLANTVHWKAANPRSPAAAMGCESCHGPGSRHIEDPSDDTGIRKFTKMRPREVSATCLGCHTQASHALWDGSMHDTRNLSCATCHSVHNPVSEHAQLKAAREVELCAGCHRAEVLKMNRVSHMPVTETAMTCSSCHNPHGSTNVRLLKVGNWINESCASCHAEKRGPFLFEHAAGRESCVTCHDPHGSSNEKMLVAKLPMLCQRCHIGSRHPSTIYDNAALQANSNRLIGRGCVNCHQNIHGSNHPSGQTLTR